MKKLFKDVVGGFWSLMVGMGITMREFVRKPVTVRYPRESLPMSPRHRSHLVLKANAETGENQCIACNMCVKACPSECLSVEGEKKEGAKKKSATSYQYNYTTCSLCGACVEACPVDAIEYSKRYNLTSATRTNLQEMDLLKDLEERNKRTR